MWIIKVALNRPYTFIVLALLILIIAPVVIFRTPTDIFPNIDIPVISVAWTYTGLNPEELEGRLTTPYEKSLTTLVDNIEHIESTTYNGMVVVKLFLQPNASLDYGQRAGHRRIADSCCASCRPEPSRRRSSISARPACPFCNWASPARDSPKTQLNDLSLELSAPATGHRARRRGPLSLWRQAAAGHDQHERRPAAVEGPLAAGSV